MHLRWAAVAVAAVLAVLCPARAFAWQEAHEVGDEARVAIASDGTAVVDHVVRWHVVRGPLKAIDVAGVDPRAAVEPEVTVTSDDGRTSAASAVRRDDGAVRVEVDDPHGLGRGTYGVDVRWRIDLVAAGALVRDGGTWRLTLSAPPPSDPVDSAKLVVDAPAAPDAPQAVLPETGLPDESEASSVRRDPGRDVLTLVRLHVGRGEVVAWTIRLDRKAVAPAVTTVAAPQPGSALAGARSRDRWRSLARLLGLGALAAAFGGLVAAKTRAVQALCAAGNARVRPLVPLPGVVRAVVGGASLAAGLTLQIDGRPTEGGALVAIALLLGAHRAPRLIAKPRGPGKWLVLRPGDAFVRPSRAADPFDVDTRAGLLAAAAIACSALAAAVVLRRVHAELAWTLLVDLAVVVPLVVTGRASQLRPDMARDAAAWLAAAYRKLSAREGLRVAPWARVALGGALDELRLLVAPRASLPGFVGVELGLAWSATPVGWSRSPEVLVRVLEATAASAKLARCAPGLRVVPGRRPDERVARLLPREPTRGAAVALVRALAEALTDRRFAGAPAWAGPERRRPAVAPAAVFRPGSSSEISALQRAC